MKLLKGFIKISGGYNFHYYRGDVTGLAVISRTDKYISIGNTVKDLRTTDRLIADGFNPIDTGKYETT